MSSLSQIQLVDDGADTTSPETPEPSSTKVPKRGEQRPHVAVENTIMLHLILSVFKS